MADLQLRFHKDILVLSGNLDSALASYGIDVERDREFTHLFEPETVLEALKMENPVTAHKDGVITDLSVDAGAAETQGAVLCEIK